MNNKEFTVLLSVYWKEKPEFLAQALNSIYTNQTLKPQEIVIVKDGPLTPELDSTIYNFTQTAPATIVTLPHNQGLGKALNEGLKYCTHELIARMDSDDISYPQRFELQVKYMQEHPEIDVLSAQIDEFSEEITNIQTSRVVPEMHEDIIKMARTRNPINHVATIFKKSSVLQSNGYMDFWQFEDYYLWARMIHNGAKFHNLTESLVAVRFSNTDMTRRHGWKYACNEYRFQKELYRLGITRLIDLLTNIPSRFILRLAPKWILYKVYKTFLRK